MGGDGRGTLDKANLLMSSNLCFKVGSPACWVVHCIVYIVISLVYLMSTLTIIKGRTIYFFMSNLFVKFLFFETGPHYITLVGLQSLCRLGCTKTHRDRPSARVCCMYFVPVSLWKLSYEKKTLIPGHSHKLSVLASF